MKYFFAVLIMRSPHIWPEVEEVLVCEEAHVSWWPKSLVVPEEDGSLSGHVWKNVGEQGYVNVSRWLRVGQHKVLGVGVVGGRGGGVVFRIIIIQ